MIKLRARRSLLFAMLAFVLIGCANATPPAATRATEAPPTATTAPAPTEPPTAITVPAPTEPPTATTVPAPTEPPTAITAPVNAAGNRMFQIEPAKSEVSYELQEQFLNRDLPNMVIGTTKALSGTFVINSGGQPGGAVTRMEVDLRTLVSDSSRRDSRLRTNWLESDTFPIAVFVGTSAQDVPASYTEGDVVSFKLQGDLTVRDVTRPVTFDVSGKLADNTVTGTATTRIMMQDYGITPPDIAGMLKVTDGVTITVKFTATEKP